MSSASIRPSRRRTRLPPARGRARHDHPPAPRGDAGAGRRIAAR
jgi:hypothetical protein